MSLAIVASNQLGLVQWPVGPAGAAPVDLSTFVLDGTLAKAQPQVTERLMKQLARMGADVILTFGPDGFTGHPDHIAVGKATEEAASKVSPSSAVYHVILGKQLDGGAKVAGEAVFSSAKALWGLLSRSLLFL